MSIIFFHLIYYYVFISNCMMNKISFEYVEQGIYNNLEMYLNGINIGSFEWVDHNYNASEIIEFSSEKSYNTFKDNDSLAYIEYFHIEPEFRGKGSQRN